MLDETFKIAILILASTSIIFFIFSFFLIKKLIEERNLQNTWTFNLKLEWEKEVIELKRTTMDSVKDFHFYAREIARKEHKNIETILKNNRLEIKNVIEDLKSKLEEIEPRIEYLRRIEDENKDLRKENRRLQNTLNRISSKIKKGK
jgi:gas vesicle protein